MTHHKSPRNRPHGGGNGAISIVVAADWAPIRALEPMVRSDPDAVYGDMLPVLRSADLRIVNCECALTAARKSVWKSGAVFKGLPAHVAGLTRVPFEVACLANNHVFDYGIRGFRDTLDVLRRNGIRTVGAGLSLKEALSPLTVLVKGTRVTILNFSEGEDLTASRGGPGVCGWELDRLLAIVRKFKKRGDFVIAVGHAGLEYVPFPPPYVVEAYRALAEAGADCVIGHHPHVPQGLEVRGGRLVAYSLGNFVFWQDTDLYFRKTGFCLLIHVRGNRLSSYELLPYRITEQGLRKLGRREETGFLKKISLISRPLRSASGIAEAWQAYIAYYGPDGFLKEVLGILEKMRSEPRKGAAMFRNRITTLQHSELWRDALTRFMADRESPVPAAMTHLIKEWFTKTTPSGSA
ncbi:MAG: CapA family protein [Candidatus Aminicenantes bacterium]|nr:CapA family protein [Candidatus Aminicenantes bacterium]TFG57329.1 MAG: CapA family protein [Candidatus Aminicenantes bacterium]